MDSIKNYFADGYTDRYTGTFNTNPLSIQLRSKWINHRCRSLTVKEITFPVGAINPSLHAYCKFYFLSDMNNSIGMSSGLSVDTTNSPKGFIVPYLVNESRHHYLTGPSAAFAPNDSVYVFSGSTVRVEFYDENDVLINFNGKPYFIDLSLSYGATQLKL